MSNLLWVLLIACALWMSLRFLPAGWEWHRPLPELIALIPLLSIPLLLLTTLSIINSAWAQAIAATLLLTLEALWQLPFCVKISTQALSIINDIPSWAQSSDESDQSGVLHLLTLNCKYGKADAKTIVRIVQNKHIDILALQEVTQELLERLDSSGIAGQLPYRSVGQKTTDDNGGFNVLFSNTKPASKQSVSVALPASAVPTMLIPWHDKSILFASAHPKSPQRGALNWGDSILSLAGLNMSATIQQRNTNASAESQSSFDVAAAQAHTSECVVMGDLNSSIFHPSLRRLLRNGQFLDGALALHKGIHPSFPANWSLIPPLIEIDHILLSRGLVMESMKTIRVPSTDHLGLSATISYTNTVASR